MPKIIGTSMVDHNGEVVIVLNGDEAWDVFLRLVYSAQADSPLIESALRKFAGALGSDWALVSSSFNPYEGAS